MNKTSKNLVWVKDPIKDMLAPSQKICITKWCPKLGICIGKVHDCTCYKNALSS